MLELVLKAFGDLFKLFNVVLHVLEEILLLLLLLFLVGRLFGFLHRHVLLELIKEGRELLLQVVVLLAELSDFLIEELLLFVHCSAVYFHRFTGCL